MNAQQQLVVINTRRQKFYFPLLAKHAIIFVAVSVIPLAMQLTTNQAPSLVFPTIWTAVVTLVSMLISVFAERVVVPMHSRAKSISQIILVSLLDIGLVLGLIFGVLYLSTIIYRFLPQGLFDHDKLNLTLNTIALVICVQLIPIIRRAVAAPISIEPKSE